jgi:hypothetical protein
LLSQESARNAKTMLCSVRQKPGLIDVMHTRAVTTEKVKVQYTSQAGFVSGFNFGNYNAMQWYPIVT